MVVDGLVIVSASFSSVATVAACACCRPKQSRLSSLLIASVFTNGVLANVAFQENLVSTMVLDHVVSGRGLAECQWVS